MNKHIERGNQSTKIFDNRSLEHDYATLIPVLRSGMKVLDVGCGTGAISKDIAERVGPMGYVIGIDNTEQFIKSGQESYDFVPNLVLIHADLFTYEPQEKFDLIVAARVLQWLNNPQEAIAKMKSMLRKDGQLSILDYNHNALEWKPEPPQSMQKFYQTFLKWRADAGMNNAIAENMADYFKEAGLQSVEVLNANETYTKDKENFTERAGIWSKVAQSRQMVEEGYLTDEDRLQAIEEYNRWIATEAELMIMKLKETRGTVQELIENEPAI